MKNAQEILNGAYSKIAKEILKEAYAKIEQHQRADSLVDEIILQAMHEYASQSRWVKVSDRLPEVGTSVLTYPHFRVLPFGHLQNELSNNFSDNDFWQ